MRRLRTYSVPGRYRAVLDAAVNKAVEEINLDIYRRANGHAPIYPDDWINEAPAPDAIVAIDSVVIVADADVPVAEAIAQARETAREERRLAKASDQRKVASR